VTARREAPRHAHKSVVQELAVARQSVLARPHSRFRHGDDDISRDALQIVCTWQMTDSLACAVLDCDVRVHVRGDHFWVFNGAHDVECLVDVPLCHLHEPDDLFTG
jgi:hypothetical protein